MNGTNLENSRKSTAIAAALARIAVDSLPLLRTALLESLDTSEAENPLNPPERIRPNREATFLVVAEFTPGELAMLLALSPDTPADSEVVELVFGALDSNPASRNLAIAGLRSRGVAFSLMVAGQVEYRLTDIGSQVRSQILEDGLVEGFERFIDVTTRRRV